MRILDLALLQLLLGAAAGRLDSGGTSADADARSPCQKSLAVGSCSGKIPRYYYNAEKDRCFKFHYSGCDGNSNRFISRKHCVKRCSQRRIKKIRLKNKKPKVPKVEAPTVPIPKAPELPKLTATVVVQKPEDECASCHRTFAKCVDGSCQCLPGFVGNGQDCADIDECADDPTLCHEKAYCINTEGSYYCECQVGYAGSGTNCTLHADICSQPFDKRYLQQCDKRGHWEIRFYFDAAVKMCRRFWYGGCAYKENQNIFADAQSCELLCATENNFRIDRREPKGRSKAIRNDNICLDDFDERKLQQCGRGVWQPRFFFNKTSARCEMFWFDDSCRLGAVGSVSRNIFVHKSTCRRLCEDDPGQAVTRKPTIGVITASLTVMTPSTTEAPSKDVLWREEKLADGSNEIPRSSTPPEKVGAVVSMLTDNKLVEEKDESQNNVRFSEKFKMDVTVAVECLDTFDHNLTLSCSDPNSTPNWQNRYYFDPDKRQCVMFWHDGCRSRTRNSFEDLATCQWKCEGQQPTPRARSCLDKFDVAYRSDCNNGRFEQRYFFDHKTKKCTLFYYGRCVSRSKNIFTDHTECKELCETPGKELLRACTQPFDRSYMHSCATDGQFVQHYYFDQETATCRMFWYGNCRGSNENIFPTIQTCQWLCERRSEEKVPMHCLDKFDKHYEDSCGVGAWKEMWFFDHVSGMCKPFWHDDCISASQNIFSSKESCQTLCELPALPYVSPAGERHEAESFRCLEERAVGHCRENLPAFAYNKYTGRCEPFAYSGCGGNGNRFLTLQQCEELCTVYSHVLGPETDCFLPLSVGQGRDDNACLVEAGFRFYYNKEYGRCARFWYFGCGGNGNRFFSHSTCEHTCRLTKHLVATRRELPPVSACFEGLNKGGCQHGEDRPMERWGYTGSKCEKFMYNGCRGNANRFSSAHDCQKVCGKLIAPNSGTCAHWPDWGKCNQLRYMWFYNLTSGVCEQFLWGGCDGNTNRFSTFELCQITCEVPGEDICQEKLDRGNWCESMSNRYYYHAASRTCKGFHYTGCGKSRNNFIHLQDCEDMCIRRTKTAADLAISTDGNRVLSSKSDKGVKPTEKSLMRRHVRVSGDSRSFIKTEAQWADYGQCLGFRYNVSGAFTRLNSYLCLMEENGVCQTMALSETRGVEKCRVLRPWRRGHHLYSWFFTVNRKPWKRTAEFTRPPTANDTVATLLILPLNDCFNIC
ncbi:hypothetical protein QR680_005752 [Steinernema hermaphroditum]|uniref:Kunitz/Bovine pancreatic trypsin inhibitor domain protein n=1 Tax=Steinernema hermaphroditum TaxID=289476 RepID=A0AA39HT89_9BILA|nr:hypothetical protein QR680_005752 [Steinernema hermaphroditum]